MRIICDSKLATLTFVPVEAEEKRVIASIATKLKPGDKMVYGGRKDFGDNREFCDIRLHAGGRKATKTEDNGKGRFTYPIHIGGTELVLHGSTEEDKHEVNRLRDICFFRTGGLVFLGKTKVKGDKAIIITGEFCKLCNKQMVRFVDCEWGICDACAAKCKHNYVFGPVHSKEGRLGEYCDKCGRGKPRIKGKKAKARS